MNRIPMHRPAKVSVRQHEPQPHMPDRMRGRKLQRERKRLFDESPLCVCCYGKTPRVIRAATERDHIVPLAMGGQDTPANTQPLCDECHEAKTKDDLRRIAQWKASGAKRRVIMIEREPVIA